MNAKTEQALLATLGHFDGSLEPQPLEPIQWQADMQLKASFRETNGLRMDNPGDSGAAKKRHQRAVTELERLGYITSQGKHLSLAGMGHGAARETAGLPTLEDAMDLLAAIRLHPRRWTDGWVSECSICGLAPLPTAKPGTLRIPEERLNFLLAHLMPLLVEKLIDWRPLAIGADCDTMLYQISEKGLSTIDKGDGDAGRWLDAIAQPKRFELPDTYAESWSAAFRARQTATPPRPHQVAHLDPTDAPRILKSGNRPGKLTNARKRGKRGR